MKIALQQVLVFILGVFKFWRVKIHKVMEHYKYGVYQCRTECSQTLFGLVNK